MHSQLFAVGIAMIALTGCSHAPLAPDAAQGLTLTLTLSSTQVQRGRPDTVAVTISNTNRYPVSLSAGGCPILFYVIDGAGKTVVPSGGGWFCIAILTQINLAPGEQQTRSFVWDTDSLAPGPYSVYGSFTADGIYLQTESALVQLT